MKARVLLWLSLGLNVLLAALIVRLSEETEEHFSQTRYLLRTSNGPAIKTNVVLRRQFFTWAQVESSDYPEYIRNLRSIGCPEKTIRDIIVADVNETFAARISREIVLPEQQWWRPEPDMDVFESAANQIRALESEKNALLTQLLGPGWNESPRTATGDPIRLDGPILSQMSPETKASLFQIEANARRARENYLRQSLENGLNPDPLELARLRQQTRSELAALLTPEQLEEYLLRYSPTSESLRQQLRGFGANSDEFRRIFRVRDPFDEQLALLLGNDPATQRRRAELERQRDEAIRQTLGAERFPLYQLTENPLFREAQQKAEQNGAAPEKVLPIFQVNQAAQQELARIEQDPDLTPEERLAALRLVEEQQQASIRRIIEGAPAEP